MRAVQVYFVPHNLELRRRLVEEEERINADADPAQRAWAASARAQVGYGSGDDEATLRANHERWCEAADRVGDPAIAWAARFGDVMVAMLWSDLGEAERLLEAAGRYATETGQPDALQVYAGQLLSIRSLQGRGAEVLDLVAEVAAATPSVPAFRSALASLYADVGRPDEARAILDDFCAAGIDRLRIDPAWSNLVSGLVETAGEVGHRGVAEQVAPLVEPFRDQVAFTGITVDAPFALTIGVCAGLLERYDDAEIAFEKSLTVSERIGSRYWIAHTKLEWARLLHARGGDRERMVALVGESVEIARERGYGVIEARAARLLIP
jgi:hypothetical protein